MEIERRRKEDEEKDRLNILFSLVHLSRPAARQRERVQGKEKKKSLEAKPAIYDLDLRSVLWKMRTRIELPPQFMREFLRGRICRVFQSAADLPERTCTENFTPSIRRLHVYKVYVFFCESERRIVFFCKHIVTTLKLNNSRGMTRRDFWEQ